MVTENKEKRWYVVQTHATFELRAKEALEERIRKHNMEEAFGEIQVPQETVVELVKGQKKTSSKKFFPGYILVQMAMNEDTWLLVKDTPRILGFIGNAKDPEPLEQVEVDRILNQVAEGKTSPRTKMNFENGQLVKVIDGPFMDLSGVIDEVKQDKGKLRVLINIFGRSTPVELEFGQVIKAS
ncbi:MAG TPA: transcription termination/antitermination protein NusG [Oligoflexia bacterium]|nr:transcription termination/antitermination protein NusG [Oligoflexia bacterium]HMP26393.1 transcription termination/antitermination protein NusG [Oligoflexia bacterium]